MIHKYLILPAVFILTARSVVVADQMVPLIVTEPAGIARTDSPVSGGVPIGPLRIQNSASLLLVDANGTTVPTQFSPLVTLEDGTIAWVLVDFLTTLKAGESKEYRLTSSAKVPRVPEIRSPVQVKQAGDRLSISNGLLTLVLSTKNFNLFESVVISGRELLDPAQPPTLKLVRASDGVTFTTRDGAVESVRFEDSGPVRSTVRIDGTYGDGKGGSWLKYTARITVWAGSPDVKVLYAIRNVNPAVAEMAQIRQDSAVMKLTQTAAAANYVVGAAAPCMSRLSRHEAATSKPSQWHNAVELAQVGPCEAVTSKSHRRFHHLVDYEDAGYRVRQYQPADRKPVVDIGFHCDGWVYLEGNKGGCQIWLRNFSEDNPKRLIADVDGLITLDLIPEYEGRRQPYYAEGGYWLGDRSHRTYEIHFFFFSEPVITVEDVKRWEDQFENYIPLTGSSAEKLMANVRQARDALQLVSTPEWYTTTGELWGVVPSLADEMVAAKAMGRVRLSPSSPLDAGERFATEFIHYENFHYRSEWDAPGDALLEFLRTGEWHFFKRAHSYARNYRDLGVPRTDGLTLGDRPRGAFHKVGAVERWGKFCECQIPKRKPKGQRVLRRDGSSRTRSSRRRTL